MKIKELYAAGRRFRVIREGARFEGLLLFGEASMSGWSRKIEPGEILTCLGWKEVDVFGAHVAGVMWTGQKVPDNAMVMQVWPFESLFRPYPMTGVLEPYVEPGPDAELEEILADVMRTPLVEAIEDGDTVDLTTHLVPFKPAPKDEEEDEILDLTGY